MSDIINYLKNNESAYSKHDLSEQINLIMSGLSVIKFKTLNNTKLYGMYDPERTTLGNLINTFFDNYECKEMSFYEKNEYKQISRDKLILFSEEHKKRICDNDLGTRMVDFEFNKMTNITLKIMDSEINVPITKLKIEKNNTKENLEEKITELKHKIQIYDENNHDENNQMQCKKMQLFVKMLTGKTITILVLDSFLVSELKALIAYTENIPIDQLSIIFAAKQFENNNKLSDYKVSECSTLHLVLRLRGGMYHETSGRAGNYNSLKSCLFLIPADLDDSDEFEKLNI